jgi:hypothetical protein
MHVWKKRFGRPSTLQTLQNNATVHKKSHNISLSRCLYSWKWVHTHSTVQTILGEGLSFKVWQNKDRVLRIFWSIGMMNVHSHWRTFCTDSMIMHFNHFQIWWIVKKFRCINVTLSLLLCRIVTPSNLFQNLLFYFLTSSSYMNTHCSKGYLIYGILIQEITWLSVWFLIAYCASTEAGGKATWGLEGMSVPAHNV